jgi:RNase P/RNase MRP subunit p30
MVRIGAESIGRTGLESNEVDVIGTDWQEWKEAERN